MIAILPREGIEAPRNGYANLPECSCLTRGQLFGIHHTWQGSELPLFRVASAAASSSSAHLLTFIFSPKLSPSSISSRTRSETKLSWPRRPPSPRPAPRPSPVLGVEGMVNS